MKEKVRQGTTTKMRNCSLDLGRSLCSVEWSLVVVPRNLFLYQMIKCISASRTCFQIVIS